MSIDESLVGEHVLQVPIEQSNNQIKGWCNWISSARIVVLQPELPIRRSKTMLCAT